MECTKKACPPLADCLHSEAVRAHPLDCCKACPAPAPSSPAPPRSLGSQGEQEGGEGEGKLERGGCRWKGVAHSNGEVWHPSVVPWGEMPCVHCACKVRGGDRLGQCCPGRCGLL